METAMETLITETKRTKARKINSLFRICSVVVRVGSMMGIMFYDGSVVGFSPLQVQME